MAQVNFSPAALADLKSIYSYISIDSEFYAEKVVNKLVARTGILENNIKIGKIVPEFDNDAIRELIEGHYRIIYKIITKDEIAILRIYHGARLLKELP